MLHQETFIEEKKLVVKQTAKWILKLQGQKTEKEK